MESQRGLGAIGVVIILVTVSIIGAAGYFVYQSKNKTNKTTDNSSQSQSTEGKVDSAYKGWKDKSFNLITLTFKAPPDWQDISDNTKFQDYKYEEIKLKASDDFILTVSVNNLPRGYEAEPNNEVLEFKDIDSSNQYIIADNANGKVGRIYVGSGVNKLGEKILPVPNVGKDGLNIEIIGLYDNEGIYDKEFSSLDEFNSKKSVQEAKLILESLKFN